jgi:hypothetical protein
MTVALKLRSPIPGFRIGELSPISAVMAVPEAAMYKDDLAMPNEDDIWVSRKL